MIPDLAALLEASERELEIYFAISRGQRKRSLLRCPLARPFLGKSERQRVLLQKYPNILQ